jgi:hypothetical protein
MTSAMSIAALRTRIADQRRQDQEVLHGFTCALASANVQAMPSLFERIEARGLWRPGLRAVRRLPRVPISMRRHWLDIWHRSGDHIRSEVNDDLLLAAALRRLLPEYRGPDLTLFRGDSAWNRRRRTYGMAWSRREGVADSFAMGGWRNFCTEGSVLLRATVPAAAIIATIPRRRDAYDEAEVLVDRRRLARVEVVRRYSHQPAGSRAN